MGGHPKALAGVPDPDGIQLRAPGPFDDLLIKARIKVGLVMRVPRKVDLNAALTDRVIAS